MNNKNIFKSGARNFLYYNFIEATKLCFIIEVNTLE